MSTAGNTPYGKLNDSMTDDSVDTAKIQERGRISFPDEKLEMLGLETGDSVLIIPGDGELRVKSASVENVK